MKIMKKFLIVLIVFMMIFTIAYCLYSSFAISGDVAKSSFNGEGASMYNADEKSYKILGTVLDVVRFATIGIGLVMLTILGAKYMLASPNERAEIKQHLIVYVIGAFIMFGASALVGIVQMFASVNIQS